MKLQKTNHHNERKSHAKHNEKASNYLYRSGNYSDWVVTTAFYSALHYVEYEIFPYTLKGKKYNKFANYYKHIRSEAKKLKRKPVSQHKATIELVKKELNSGFRYYQSLFNLCRTARYHSYKIGKLKAKKAQSDLRNLKKHLSKI